MEHLAAAIDEASREIEERWLDAVRSGLQLDHVPPTDLKEGIQDYLVLIAEVLRGDGDLARRAAEAWRDVARDHALTRIRLGFDVEQLVRELGMLRRAISAVLQERGMELSAEAVETLTVVVDAAVAASLRSYVDARDYAARQARAEHLGFLSHHLKGPLGAAALAADALRREGLPADAHGRLLDRLERNLRRALDLTEEVLAVERHEAGKVECEPSEVALGAVLDDLVENARHAAEARGLSFAAIYDPALSVRLDARLVRSAIEQLLENAVKYADHGQVALEVDDGPAALSFHVWDACPGLSDEELRVVFEPFRRGRTRKPGAGLGLSIARRAVEAHGGRIGADSTVGAGCHFWFTLPKALRPSGSVEPRVAHHPERGH